VKLPREYLPATGGTRQDLVLLHGWGCNREIWRPLLARIRGWAGVTLLDIPGLAPGLASGGIHLKSLLQAILASSPPRAVYVGWSLGGQLALELAARYPGRVSGVVTLCSNPKFVAHESWPGMDPALLESFAEQLASDATAALSRFDTLQVQGSGRPRPLLRQLRALRKAAAGDELAPGLRWLGELDQRSLLAAAGQPRLHLFAGADRLVPPGCGDATARLSGPGSRVATLDGIGHVLPLEAPEELASRVERFLAGAGLLHDDPGEPPRLAKSNVAESFSRAAPRYDSVATLQRDVGTRLLNNLDLLEGEPETILDLGCGTGYFYPELARRFPLSQYVGLDLAGGMVEYARRRHPDGGCWLVGDAESLPLAADSVDLVFSSLAIQWCYRPELLFAELARVLRPGGRCVFTSLGPDTLRELRAAWAAVDQHEHVNTFLPAAELESAALRSSGLRLELEAEQISMRYQRVRDLLTDLKTLGAHNVNRHRPPGLTGRRVMQGMLESYEEWRRDGALPATYDVLYGVLEKR